MTVRPPDLINTASLAEHPTEAGRMAVIEAIVTDQSRQGAKWWTFTDRPGEVTVSGWKDRP